MTYKEHIFNEKNIKNSATFHFLKKLSNYNVHNFHSQNKTYIAIFFVPAVRQSYS